MPTTGVLFRKALRKAAGAVRRRTAAQAARPAEHGLHEPLDAAGLAQPGGHHVERRDGDDPFVGETRERFARGDDAHQQQEHHARHEHEVRRGAREAEHAEHAEHEGGGEPASRVIRLQQLSGRAGTPPW
jgi:hypothetical protein